MEILHSRHLEMGKAEFAAPMSHSSSGTERARYKPNELSSGQDRSVA